MDESNVWHNLLSAAGGRVECAHMHTLWQSYQTFFFGHLVVGGGQLIKFKNALNAISWTSRNVRAHVLRHPCCA